MLGSSAEVEAVGPGDSDSDFELTPSSVIDALQPDSGSDFELTALDQSDEFDAAPDTRAQAPKRGPSDSDVTGVEPSASGVNLGRPSDSGINLAAGDFDLSSADSIELSPLDDEDEKPKPAAKPAPKPAPAKPKVDPGATALPVRDSGEKDIFEDTDFEVDALDSGGDDRTVQLEATSDFDLDENDDSASEVFAIDEENVDDSAATALGAAPALAEDVFGEGISDETEAAAEGGWGDVGGEEPAAAVGAAAAVAEPATPAAGPAPAAGRRGTPDLLREAQGPEWSTPWVVALGFAAALMLLLAFVGHDLLTNLYEFQGEGTSSGLVKAIAGLMGGG